MRGGEGVGRREGMEVGSEDAEDEVAGCDRFFGEGHDVGVDDEVREEGFVVVKVRYVGCVCCGGFQGVSVVGVCDSRAAGIGIVVVRFFRGASEDCCEGVECVSVRVLAWHHQQRARQLTHTQPLVGQQRHSRQ